MRVQSSLRIDEFLPTYHFHELHSIRVDAPASRSYQAVKMLTTADIPLFVILMTLRFLSPQFIRLARGRSRTLPMLDLFEQAGFVLLADEVGREVVFGVTGRPAKGMSGRRPTKPEEFIAFSAPDHVKVATNFLVDGVGETSRVTTETRVFAIDDAARRTFAIYWLMVRPGSALIRLDWLRAIRKRAEAGG